MSIIKITKSNYDEEVKNSNEPVLIDFWASWCGPCNMLAPTIEEISQEVEGVKIGKVNVDDEPELAMKFGIMSIPTLILMKNDKIVDKCVGVRPKGEILSMIGK